MYNAKMKNDNAREVRSNYTGENIIYNRVLAAAEYEVFRNKDYAKVLQRIFDKAKKDLAANIFHYDLSPDYIIMAMYEYYRYCIITNMKPYGVENEPVNNVGRFASLRQNYFRKNSVSAHGHDIK
jgi:hypothetical protein